MIVKTDEKVIKDMFRTAYKPVLEQLVDMSFKLYDTLENSYDMIPMEEKSKIFDGILKSQVTSMTTAIKSIKVDDMVDKFNKKMNDLKEKKDG